jgi:hypothetical protein
MTRWADLFCCRHELEPHTFLVQCKSHFRNASCCVHCSPHLLLQAYEGLQTAEKLRQQYLFLPAKVKEVYLVHLLGQLEELQCRSAIIFAGTCKVREGLLV